MKAKVVGLSLCLFASTAMALPEIVVNRSNQSYTVIEDGKVIRAGRASTGKLGYRTPAGRFSIHAKYTKVRSAKYKVIMKYTMLFKGSLYAIHQGVVPGYPASHGCVRVPAKDARYLFSSLPIGSTVLIK
jgi:lipoprotein-anchoring transpeptidase ErfK/SrfK